MTLSKQQVWEQHINQGLSEADLVAEFYHQCRVRGWHCELECALPSSEHLSGYMRADAVIRRKKNCVILCAVEFKKYGSKPRELSPQTTGYAVQDFPVFYCLGAHEVFQVIEEIGVLVDGSTDEDEDFWDLVESSYIKKAPLYL